MARTKSLPKNSRTSDYLDFYNRYVIPITKAVYNDIEEEFKSKYNPVIINDEDAYEKKYASTFRKNRRILKDYCYKSGEHDFLNQFKLAAVLCKTLMDCKRIKFDSNVQINRTEINKHDYKWLVHNLFINYKIAFFCSEALLFDTYLGKKKPDKEKDELCSIGHFYNYGTEYDDNTFVNNMIVQLARNCLAGVPFDYLTYALMMYQWYNYSLERNNRFVNK